MLECADSMAERVAQLGGVTVSDAKSVGDATRLSRLPDTGHDSNALIAMISSHRGALCEELRAGIDRTAEAGDAVTSDLLTEQARELDKQLWFIESHLPS